MAKRHAVPKKPAPKWKKAAAALHDELLLAKKERAKERLHRQRIETMLEGLASKMGVEVPPRVESDEEKDPSTHHQGKELVVFRDPAEVEIGEDTESIASGSADDEEVVSVGEDEDPVSSRAADAATSESERMMTRNGSLHGSLEVEKRRTKAKKKDQSSLKVPPVAFAMPQQSKSENTSKIGPSDRVRCGDAIAKQKRKHIKNRPF